MNVVETIAGVDAVFPPSKKEKCLNFILAELLRCIIDHIVHIHMYFIYINTVEIIAGVVVASPPSKNRKNLKIYFC